MSKLNFSSRIFLIIIFYLIHEAYSMKNKAPGKICPPDYMTKPCTCSGGNETYVTLTCENIKHFEELLKVFDTAMDYQFGRLTLDKSTLIYLSSDVIKMRLMTELEIKNTELFYLFNNIPPEKNALKNVFLINTTFIKGFDWKFFSTLQKLKTLNITHTKAGDLNENFMKSVSKDIVNLEISFANVYRVDDKCFSEFRNLSYLDLTSNHITLLKRSMFPASAKLKALHVGFNMITSLPKDLFNDMPVIEVLGLSHNFLKTIGKDFNKFIPDGVKLDLNFNPIVCNCEMKWIPKMKQNSTLEGTCDQPLHLKNKNLRDLKEEQFLHCELDEYILNLFLRSSVSKYNKYFPLKVVNKHRKISQNLYVK